MELALSKSGAARLPHSWSIRTVGDLGNWLSGGTPSKSQECYWGGEIPWVSSKDMKVSRIRNSSDHVTQQAIGNGTRLAPEGAILIVVRGMILAHSLPVARVERPLAFNQDIKALVVRADVDSNFVLFWFQANANGILSIADEATHGTKRLPSGTLFSQKIALPPLREQRAIGEALSDLEELLGTQDALIAKKRALKQAATQQLLSGRCRLPGFRAQWIRTHLGSIGTFNRGRGIKKDEVLAEGLPCIRYGEIYTRHNDYIRRFHSFIARTVAARSQRLRKGDLLFAASGETAAEIGKCVAFLGEEEGFAGGDIVIFRPTAQDSMFLGYLMNHSTVTCQKNQMAQGDAVVHIGAKSLALIEIELPPPEEQEAIAAVLSDMDAEIAALEARRDKTKEIKQGMMQVLLTGRVRLV